MKIAVCVKQVPDSETRITMSGPAAELDRSGFTRVLNPYDAYAVEEAVRIKERLGGDTEITSITVGPERVMESIKKDCLAVGCDRSIRIDEPALENAEPLQIAKVLAAVIKRDGYDLILAGKQAIDDDAGQVAVMIAELLDCGHAAVVNKLELGDGTFTATREIEGGAEIVAGQLPAVITCQKGLNEPRLPSLPNIMKAGAKPQETLACADLGIEVPAALSKITTYTPPAPRAACKIIENDDLAAAARELVRLLREEAKVI
ncbi:electron transfer flavoprotein subunit beta/FixA family protein [bacterium]|nr:electron transfer flavoprotein subunit beta/FixA family protein [bacterium]MBU1072518.1 electron transfer flavoprotein subunit beta/FixA family protein [bacterium]MBU1677120.1 electron transfer flavoprotein subunit beta/FixA family protein [bacterium]